MSPESQRIAIAEACGWSVLSLSCGFYAKHKTEGRISISAGSARATQNEAMSDRVPDYLNDLNAMREAENILTTDQLVQQAEWIGACSSEMHMKAWIILLRATAAQRAKAFLLAIGKWEDEQP